ncbi:hypothetical protein K449DRAFT_201929 [Hypoxylon sp. EC38]|nr:hypothetical protein K449DRAFT_201929 [Hypoxylon sp. EC38]
MIDARQKKPWKELSPKHTLYIMTFCLISSSSILLPPLLPPSSPFQRMKSRNGKAIRWKGGIKLFTPSSHMGYTTVMDLFYLCTGLSNTCCLVRYGLVCMKIRGKGAFWHGKSKQAEYGGCIRYACMLYICQTMAQQGQYSTNITIIFTLAE